MAARLHSEGSLSRTHASLDQELAMNLSEMNFLLPLWLFGSAVALGVGGLVSIPMAMRSTSAAEPGRARTVDASSVPLTR